MFTTHKTQIRFKKRINNVRRKSLGTNVHFHNSVIPQSTKVLFLLLDRAWKALKKCIHETEYSPSHHVARNFLRTFSIIVCNIFFFKFVCLLFDSPSQSIQIFGFPITFICFAFKQSSNGFHLTSLGHIERTILTAKEWYIPFTGTFLNRI